MSMKSKTKGKMRAVVVVVIVQVSRRTHTTTVNGDFDESSMDESIPFTGSLSCEKNENDWSCRSCVLFLTQ